MTDIHNFTILGERCSGTTFLEESMKNNFHLNYSSNFNKHFFCFNTYDKEKTKDTLFIGIIRNPIYWLNSFSRELHHIPEINRKNLKNFLFNEFYSVDNEITELSIKKLKKNNIIINDLNYVNGGKYNNIFELRKLKNHYLINIMPTKVNNYILINYENLLYNYEDTLNKIQNKFNLIKKNPDFVKIEKYKKSETYNFVKQREILFPLPVINLIWDNLDKNQENNLGYIMGDNNKFFINKNKTKVEVLLESP